MRYGLLALFVAGAAVVVGDAVGDLVAAPSFAAVLRLVVEAVAAAVVSGWLWRRVSARGRRPGR